jgi:LacI family transcriptional regulator
MRRHLGRSPHQEIRRVQIQRACELLVETDLTVAEIARQCGFTRPTYFMREFRNRAGKTPSQFRREFRR